MTSSIEELCTKMKQKTEEFEKHLNTLSSINNDLKIKSTKMLEVLNEVVGDSKKTCSVCYTRQSSFACLPCGHVFCESCAQRAQNRGRCFICRIRVESFVKIFL